MNKVDLPEHLLLFDGVCNLCNASVRFVIRHDTRQLFRFASLQSDYGRRVLGMQEQDPGDSVVYFERGQMHTQSTAVLRIAWRLRFPVNLLYGLIIIPPFVRNPIYRLIARKRYRWFGRQDQCMIPGPSIAERFMD